MNAIERLNLFQKLTGLVARLAIDVVTLVRVLLGKEQVDNFRVGKSQ
jgi:hypothetical protein